MRVAQGSAALNFAAPTFPALNLPALNYSILGMLASSVVTLSAQPAATAEVVARSSLHLAVESTSALQSSPVAPQVTAPVTAQVWLSPRMPLSMNEWPRLQRLLRGMQVRAAASRDPRVSEAEWQAAIQAADWSAEELDSAALAAQTSAPDLKSQTIPEHFPSISIHLAGRAHPWPIQGVMSDGAWAQSVALRVSQLRSSSDQTTNQTLQLAAHRHTLAPSALPTPVVAHAREAKSTTAEPSPATPTAPKACIPALSYLPIDSPAPEAELGSYERVSPDGRFVLRSFSGGRLGQVALVELPEPGQTELKIHDTGLRNEAFPVQGSWRFLIDPDGTHFRFRDVLHHGPRAKPLFRAGMTGFYASASELPQNQAAELAAGKVFIRSLSWPQPDGNGPGGASDDAAIGPLQVQTLLMADAWPTSNSASVLRSSAKQFICTQRAASDGNIYALPMLSVDGLAFSAVPQTPRRGLPSMRSYSLAADALAESQPCAFLHDLGKAPSKAVFGFAHANGPQWLAFTDQAQVQISHHRWAQGQSVALPVGKFNVLASAFPGITADGRVVFAATWQDCESASCEKRAGYVVADPYQVEEVQAAMRAARLPSPECITHTDVARERQRFADFHLLAQPQSPA